MGNTGSHKRDRVFSSESDGSASPRRAFDFLDGAGKGKFSFPQLEEYDSVPSVFQDKVSDSSSRTVTVGMGSCDYESFPTMFKWEGGGKQVQLGGEFSDWKPIPMVESQGDFSLIVDLPEGEHQYKYLVDGKWMHSPKQVIVDNDKGTKNNSITIKKSDYQVFQALAEDFSASKAASAFYNSSEGFSQEIPHPDQYATIKPPPLPPYLLQVTLNKEVSLQNEPTLLPLPNHVMVNHLYALAIKDKVVVLSATLRFRTKTVTTVLYKPEPEPKPI